MAYLERMVVKLLDDMDFIQEDERAQVLKDFEETAKKKEDRNKYLLLLDNFMKHPLGALVVIAGYAGLKSWLNRIALSDSSLSLEERFKMKIKEQTFSDIMNDMDNKQ